MYSSTQSTISGVEGSSPDDDGSTAPEVLSSAPEPEALAGRKPEASGTLMLPPLISSDGSAVCVVGGGRGVNTLQPFPISDITHMRKDTKLLDHQPGS